MARKPLDPDRALASPLYAVAAILVAMAGIDFAQSVGTLHPANIQWRFATVGLLSSFLTTPLLGVSIAVVIAAVRGHRITLRILAFAGLAAAICLLLVSVGFVLDVLQLRPSVPSEARDAFVAASVRALFKLALGAMCLAWLGVRGLRVETLRTAAGREPGEIPLVAR